MEGLKVDKIMWYGKTTEELKKLNEEYYKLFGGYPFGHMELEYEADEYDEYVRDIKKQSESRNH